MIETLGNLSEAGAFLTGLAAILGLAFAVLKWILRKHQDRLVGALSATVNAQFFDLIRKHLEARAASAGPTRCRVIDVNFVDGPTVRVPVILDEWLEVLPGVTIMGDQFRDDRTVYFLRVDNTARIREHWHRCEEEVRVIKGRMIDLGTGDIYDPGSTWVIPPEEPHAAHFEAPADADGHGIVLIAVRPPLRSPEEEPLSLEGLPELAAW